VVVGRTQIKHEKESVAVIDAAGRPVQKRFDVIVLPLHVQEHAVLGKADAGDPRVHGARRRVGIRIDGPQARFEAPREKRVQRRVLLQRQLRFGRIDAVYAGETRNEAPAHA